LGRCSTPSTVTDRSTISRSAAGRRKIGRPLTGRAFETVTGIAVANYPAPRCDGHSFAVNPSGGIVAMADASPGLAVATFDLAAVRKARVEDRFRWQI
jgi:predicted amidohydrolase